MQHLTSLEEKLGGPLLQDVFLLLPLRTWAKALPTGRTAPPRGTVLQSACPGGVMKSTSWIVKRNRKCQNSSQVEKMRIPRNMSQLCACAGNALFCGLPSNWKAAHLECA